MYRVYFILILFSLSCASAKTIKKTSLRASLETQCQHNDSQACVDFSKTILADKNGDSERAFLLMKKSCESQNTMGCFYYAQLLERGIGVTQDLQKAKEFYKFACDANYIEACNNLAILLKQSGENTGEVTRLQTKGCNSGDGIACFNLGFKAERKRPSDWELAKLNYEKSCALNFAEGCYYLGFMYRYGHGVKKDLTEGAGLYRKACEGQHMIACNSMGNIYQNGTGLEKDEALATQYYEQACQQGFARACANLGTLAEGKKNISSKKSAAKLYERACDAGDGKGCSRLGLLLLQGKHGAAKNKSEARARFLQACEQGYGQGCCNLGVIEEEGIGKKIDYIQAIAFYQKACKFDEYQGCHNLGVMYAEGVGQDQDLSAAADQFMLACENGFSKSCTYLGKKWMQIKDKSVIGRTLVERGCKEGDQVACDFLKRKK